MALVTADRVLETTITVGTGPLVLDGAATGYRRFSSVCSIGDTVNYAVQGVTSSGLPTTEWETGTATYSAANTLTRTTVTSSSTGGAVNFSTGTKQVILAFPADGVTRVETSANNAATSATTASTQANLATTKAADASTFATAAQTARGGAEAAQAGTIFALAGTSLANATLNAASRALLAALSTASGLPAVLTEKGREGLFVHYTTAAYATAFNRVLATDITNDAAQGTLVATATGAWRRDHKGMPDVSHFGAALDGVTDDSAALQAAFNYATANNRRGLTFKGTLAFSTTITLATKGVALVGPDAQVTASGSTDQKLAVLQWTGGASPMFSMATTAVVFKGLSVQNLGSATDFIEMNTGAQRLTLDDLSILAVPNAFSRSVVRANGNFLGYSRIRKSVFKSCAPTIFDIDGLGTSNGMTDMRVDDCQFNASVGGTTIFKMVDEVIELLSFHRNTFIPGASNELCIVDTAQNSPTAAPPLDPTIYVLDVSGNEFDAVSPSPTAARYFKLKNVKNFAFNLNKMNCGGFMTAAGSLTNSHVTSCTGNEWASLPGPLFELLDAVSTVTCGPNNPTLGNARGVYDVASGGITQLTQGAGMITTLARGNSFHHKFSVSVTSASAFSFTFIAAQSLYDRAAPGTLFTYIVKNDTAGAIANPTFSVLHTLTGGTFHSPGAGLSRAITFLWDGTTALEVKRQTLYYSATSGGWGAVTQATSKSTAVTLARLTGQITTAADALAAGVAASFTLTNSLIAATDNVIVNIASGATPNSYHASVDNIAAGNCRVLVRNFSAGSLAEALVLNYAVLKAVPA